jgi:hypothetical protein
MPAASAWPEVGASPDDTREHLVQLYNKATAFLEAISLNISGKIPRDKIKALLESIIACADKGRKQPAPEEVLYA